ncbi:hypothetical protein, partial [Rhizobium sp. N122]|uniref:hypothetical protein n=1 Tax=Rhizobium sp. N122 TaxID=1764272 RepID=UPI001AEC7328
MISMRAMKPLRSGINVSTNAGSNARTSPDLADQQKQLTVRSLVDCVSAGAADTDHGNLRLPACRFL